MGSSSAQGSRAQALESDRSGLASQPCDSLTPCVVLGKSLHVSEAQFPHL